MMGKALAAQCEDRHRRRLDPRMSALHPGPAYRRRSRARSSFTPGSLLGQGAPLEAKQPVPRLGAWDASKPGSPLQKSIARGVVQPGDWMAAETGSDPSARWIAAIHWAVDRAAGKFARGRNFIPRGEQAQP